MAFESILDPVFGPILKLHPAVSLALLATLMSLLITLIYKWLTDQNLMKQLKTEMKDLQKQAKSLKSDPKKAMAVQKKALETNMKYMTMSLKPTLITFLPIILIFGWLNANLAFEPIHPNTEFSATAVFSKSATGEAAITVPAQLTVTSSTKQEITNREATWTLKGPLGEYYLDIEHNGEKKQKQVLITDGLRYAKQEERYKGEIKAIKINNQPIKPFGSLSIFGWKPGWLGVYIIFSIATSLVLRKALKVH